MGSVFKNNERVASYQAKPNVPNKQITVKRLRSHGLSTSGTGQTYTCSKEQRLFKVLQKIVWIYGGARPCA